MDRKKIPSEIFKSLDYLYDDVIMNNFRVPFSDWDETGLSIHECAAISSYLEFSTNNKPFAGEIIRLLEGDAELTKPFRKALGEIIAGEAKRGKHEKITKAGRDLWLYLAIEYAELEGYGKYSSNKNNGLFVDMASHLFLTQGAIEKAYESGQKIYQDSLYHDAIAEHFKPR
jgi:hypothetical protein